MHWNTITGVVAALILQLRIRTVACCPISVHAKLVAVAGVAAAHAGEGAVVGAAETGRTGAGTGPHQEAGVSGVAPRVRIVKALKEAIH
jgi:hypothetical protein